MATINKKSGETRKNSSPGRTLFNFKMLDELKVRLELFANVTNDSMASVIERALVQYMKKYKFNDFESQYLRNLIQNVIEKNGKKVDYESQELTDLVNGFYNFPELEPKFNLKKFKAGLNIKLVKVERNKLTYKVTPKKK